MKKISLLLLLPAFGMMASCTPDCNEPTGACADTPYSDEMCQAYFESWFYNAETKTCQEIGYSGCGPKGFETEQECQACLKGR